MLGVPRLRQIRVNHTSCSIHPDMSSEIKDCFASYSASSSSAAAFGLGADYGANDTWPSSHQSQRRAWVYSSIADLVASNIDGSDPGFIQDLSSLKAKTKS